MAAEVPTANHRSGGRQERLEPTPTVGAHDGRLNERLEVTADGNRRSNLARPVGTNAAFVPIGELTTAVNASTSTFVGEAIEPGGSHRRELRVATGASHVGLPKLHDAGLIDVDTENGAVRYGGDWPSIGGSRLSTRGSTGTDDR